MSASAADQAAGVPGGRCDAETVWRPRWNRLTPTVAVIIFFGLFVSVFVYFGQTKVFATFKSVPQFGLFIVLMAALAGLAGATALHTIIWLTAMTKIAVDLTWRSWIRLSLAVLCLGLLIFGFLIFGGILVSGDLVPILNADAELNAATRPVTLSIAVLQSPALVGCSRCDMLRLAA